MDRVCSVCGYENPIGANFCMSCGAPLSRAIIDDKTASMDSLFGPVGDEARPSGESPPLAMLVVRQGTKRGSRIALDADRITIGRHPESDIFLDDITVSRRHAEILRSEVGFEVADAGSLNGTYVNKELVEHGSLHDGDELQVGKFKLVFLALGEDE